MPPHLGEHFPWDRCGDTTFTSMDRTCSLILAPKLTSSRHFVYLVQSNLILRIFPKGIYSLLLEMASNKPEAEEVSRVNKLLQIEDLAWRKQLEKAVSGFSLLEFPSPLPHPVYSIHLKGCSLFHDRDSETPPSPCGIQAAS